jgi:fumarate hydratase class II
LAQALEKLFEYVIRRITPLRERLIELTEKSQALITLVSPLIGYGKAAELSKILLRGVSIRQALRELGFSEEDINRILDPRRLTSPGISSKKLVQQAP